MVAVQEDARRSGLQHDLQHVEIIDRLKHLCYCCVVLIWRRGVIHLYYYSTRIFEFGLITRRDIEAFISR